jgi:cytochrome c oxidase subunit 2
LFLDSPQECQMFFQDPATLVMENIIDFHHDLMFLLIWIVIFVLYSLWRIVKPFVGVELHQIRPDALRLSSQTMQYIASFEQKDPVSTIPVQPKRKQLSRFLHLDTFLHHWELEIIWTVTPAFILYTISTPSFVLLYNSEESFDSYLTLRVGGNQWFWSYEYSEMVPEVGHAFDPVAFDSYMIGDSDMPLGMVRLLEVDNRVVLPVKTHLRVLVTAFDVLHSWALPSLGVKVDACPGRLNQLNLFITRDGVFYGQCSEICGINHAFMPIAVQGVAPDIFVNWFADRSLNL